MPDDTRARLVAILDAVVGVPCGRVLALNSIKLSFGPEDDPQEDRYLWIEPPWRLSAGGRFAVGSQDCPVHDEYEDKDEYRRDLDAWAAPFGGWGPVTIAAYTLGDPIPDLALTFSSGHVLETFNRSRTDYAWYYREPATGLVLEAYATGVVDDSRPPGPRLRVRSPEGDGPEPAEEG